MNRPWRSPQAALALLLLVALEGCGSHSPAKGAKENNPAPNRPASATQDARTAAPEPAARPVGPATPKISQEQLLAAVARTAPGAEAKAIAFYEFPLKNPDRWVAIYVVNLINKADQRPAGTMVIDAYTGEVLTVFSPPSGQ